ncbi:hypothetical protein KQH40_00580 [bacterium]|nr:hypothetical protein [bacterium]
MTRSHAWKLRLLGWLRGKIGNKALADWIILRQGCGLSPRQLCSWELILAFPVSEMDRWLKA